MGGRVVRTAAELGVEADGLELIERVHRVAMEAREAQTDDQHHRDYLHPGRSALILLKDLGETDPVTLAATLIVDSMSAEWAPTDREVDEPTRRRSRSTL